MQFICKNNRLYFDYEVIDNYEAGICLLGTEVKSLRNQGGNITGAFCTINSEGIFLHESNIPKYKKAHEKNHQEKRVRPLLLRKSQKKKIQGQTKNLGLAIIPYAFYLSKNNLIKVQICLCKRRKNIQKKEYIKEREEKKTFKNNNY